MTSKADLCGYSVCAVASVRLIFYTQVNPEDYEAGIMKAGAVTVLEPLLGIIAACLPLCRPAFQKATGRVEKTKAQARNVLSSNVARLRSKRLKGAAAASQRFDDSLLFTDLESNKIQAHVSGSGDKLDYSLEGYGDVVAMPQQASILKR